jgi:hypothetical protein
VTKTLGGGLRWIYGKATRKKPVEIIKTGLPQVDVGNKFAKSGIKTPWILIALTTEVMDQLFEVFSCTFLYRDGETPTINTIGPLAIYLTKSTGNPFGETNTTTHLKGLQDHSSAQSQLGNTPINIEIACHGDEKLAKFEKDINAALRTPVVRSFLDKECPRKYQKQMEEYNWEMEYASIQWRKTMDVPIWLNEEQDFETLVARMLATHGHHPLEVLEAWLTVHISAGSLIEKSAASETGEALEEAPKLRLLPR